MTLDLIGARDAFAARCPEVPVTVGGRKWGMISVGKSGPALVLIPGTLGRADIFWQQIDALSDRARILALTYPATHDIHEWTDDIARIMDRQGVDSATVLGSSLGGYVVQAFSARHTDRTDGLIAANTLSTVAEVSKAPPYSADLARAPLAMLRGGFQQAISASGIARPETRPLVDLLLKEVGGRIPGRHLRARLMALKHAPPLDPCPLPKDRIAAIEADDDPLIPPPLREGVREFLKPSVTYRFKTGGHFPYVVRPELYTALLEERLGLPVTGPGWGKGAIRTK